MSETPPTFVRVTLPTGHFSVPSETARRGGWRVLKQDAFDKFGNVRPPKLRDNVLAATPTESEAPASVDTEE